MNKSYLKWVGSKKQLLPEILNLLPTKFNRYLSSFCGSATPHLNMPFHKEDIFSSKIESILNDSNSNLIQCHKHVKDSLFNLLRELDKWQSAFNEAENKEEFYYKQRDLLNQYIADKVLDEASSALFIGINKTCFNGLWRVNSQGFFNVPFNNKNDTVIYEKNVISKCSTLFSNCTFKNEDFEKFIFENVKEGDFVFLDPPYVPVSATSSFVSYSADGWLSPMEDNRLKKCLEFIDSQKAFFMLTNSDAPLVHELFGKWNLKRCRAHRFIKAVSAQEQREKVFETITTNYDTSLK